MWMDSSGGKGPKIGLSRKFSQIIEFQLGCVMSRSDIAECFCHSDFMWNQKLANLESYNLLFEHIQRLRILFYEFLHFLKGEMYKIKNSDPLKCQKWHFWILKNCFHVKSTWQNNPEIYILFLCVQNLNYLVENNFTEISSNQWISTFDFFVAPFLQYPRSSLISWNIFTWKVIRLWFHEIIPTSYLDFCCLLRSKTKLL